MKTFLLLLALALPLAAQAQPADTFDSTSVRVGTRAPNHLYQVQLVLRIEYGRLDTTHAAPDYSVSAYFTTGDTVDVMTRSDDIPLVRNSVLIHPAFDAADRVRGKAFVDSLIYGQGGLIDLKGFKKP